MLLEGKVAIVTGGGRGIGAGISKQLTDHGASVAIVYHQGVEAAEATAEKLVADGKDAGACQCDIRSADSVQALVDGVMERWGRVDGLVNNAIAGRQHAPFDEATPQDYEDMLDYGCRAVINTIRAVRPIMKAQGDGRVVNIVTELWNMESPEWSTYLAGKGAMVGISRALANELGPDGIRINMIAPGWMATEKVDRESDGSKGFAATLPLRYHGTGEEIGKGCVFYLSELSDYVTGAYLPITGGRITQMGS